MSFDLLVTGALCVNSSRIIRADVGVRDGLIEAIGDLQTESAEEKIDAAGLQIFPGVIDTQVHFREPGLSHKEDIYSGTNSALLGGVTTIFEMPNTSPATINKKEIEKKRGNEIGHQKNGYTFRR